MTFKILFINGPNLNLLGEREQSQYGTTTFDELKDLCVKKSEQLDIKIDFKTLFIVAGFLISGTMSYQNLKSEIELAKELPEPKVVNVNAGEVKTKMDFMQKEIDNLQEQIKDLEDKVYKKR